ncbi:MAG: phosphoribosylaminoimidazolesuccinocarboxamide synthase [Elusimicrobia bacterium]|nr:MAG: phosphoribosylaminoimidazolesuccinocarboxamide synthase [Elusimicrobiota bacterium]
MGVTADVGLERIYRGKVRDIYTTDSDLFLMVATDRISAFDSVLSPDITGKGELLTQISRFWFEKTTHIVENHMISADIDEIRKRLPEATLDDSFAGRSMLVKKARRIDAECVIRGYIAGSGWKEYRKTGAVCGHTLPTDLKLAQKLPTPIFTPATKADQGHDENISRKALAELVGANTASELERLSLELYTFASAHMADRGLILADTKFEFGIVEGKITLIDEALTPDSSRFWEAAKYKEGQSPASFDKQFVRDYLEMSGWDKNPPAPTLPKDVVSGTIARYREALKRLTP